MFERIAGQQRIKERFEQALREGTLSHAYLFTGREGLAKTAFARELAVALVSACGACGACPDCARARRGVHPGLHVLEREGDVIRVDQVEPLIADLSLKPFGAGSRVWVIPEVESLHPAAASKLLKSIEEPPRFVHFILVTDHLERVLPTIVSRCRQIDFRPLSDGEVIAYLQTEHGLEGARAEALARLASGSVESAERLAHDALGPGRRSEYLTQAAVLTAGRSSGTEAAEAAFIDAFERHKARIKETSQAELARRASDLEQKFQEKRELKWQQENAAARARREEARLVRLAAQDAVDVLGSWLRDLWVVACGASEVLCNRDREAEVVASAVAAPEHYALLLSVVARTRKDLYLNVDQKLALQALLARFEEVAGSA